MVAPSDLASYGAFEAPVIRVPVSTHAALAELLDDLVATDSGADVQDAAIVPSWDSRKGMQERRLVTSEIGKCRK